MASPVDVLTQFLGQPPSEAALRRKDSGAGQGVPSRPPPPPSSFVPNQKPHNQARHRCRSADSSPDSDGVPVNDGGFDDGRDVDANAPFSSPAPRRIPELDDRKDFDCCQYQPPIAEIAPKRPKAESAYPQRRAEPPPASGGGKDVVRPPRPQGGSGQQMQSAASKNQPLKRNSSHGPPPRANGLAETITPAPGGLSSFLGAEGSPTARSSPTANGAPHRSSSRPRSGSRSRESGGARNSSAPPPSDSKSAALALNPLGSSGRIRFGGRA
eukprot:gnl/TRDRNA2_/TRDRNA2_166308_c1_seq1.p1 gnl/TRDRNA2_/TRDRNA2_166308_c1~~gnl/TRDRNA2_/TRDRNA2_166308_c1_seq1.p1  ORF type:complete len:284 (-),score=40.47 gnl/TRDRNA2_/TRDRNA2_166308_c1_seq1:145-954(-)